MSYSSGDTYSGFFKNNKRHGQGTYVYKNGTKLTYNGKIVRSMVEELILGKMVSSMLDSGKIVICTDKGLKLSRMEKFREAFGKMINSLVQKQRNPCLNINPKLKTLLNSIKLMNAPLLDIKIIVKEE